MSVSRGREGALGIALCAQQSAAAAAAGRRAALALALLVQMGITASSHRFYKPPTQEDIENEKNIEGTYELGYKIPGDLGENTLDTEELTDIYRKCIEHYPIVVLEDPYEDEAWMTWAQLTEEFGRDVQILGNALLRSNGERTDNAALEKACNGVTLNLLEQPTVTELIRQCKKVQGEGWGVAIGVPPGDTSDHFIADLACSLACSRSLSLLSHSLSLSLSLILSSLLWRQRAAQQCHLKPCLWGIHSRGCAMAVIWRVALTSAAAVAQAVGLQIGQVKAGGLRGFTSVATYNQLARIEDEVGDQAEFIGDRFRRPI